MESTALKDIDDSLDAITSSITNWDLMPQALIAVLVEYGPLITIYDKTFTCDFDDLRTKFINLK